MSACSFLRQPPPRLARLNGGDLAPAKASNPIATDPMAAANVENLGPIQLPSRSLHLVHDLRGFWCGSHPAPLVPGEMPGTPEGTSQVGEPGFADSGPRLPYGLNVGSTNPLRPITLIPPPSEPARRDTPFLLGGERMPSFRRWLDHFESQALIATIEDCYYSNSWTAKVTK